MVSMPVPPCDTADLQRQLLMQYGIEIPCFKWADHHIVRVSVQGYNTDAQMDHLVDALAALLK
jgi:isopenicillin-N epimerase